MIEKFGIPVLFGSMLMEDHEALSIYTNMSENRKKQIIEGSGNIQDEAEMRCYIKRMILDCHDCDIRSIPPAHHSR